MDVLGLCGSLRRESYNRRLLAAAAKELPETATFQSFDDLEAIPAYNEDAEARATPAAVRALRRAIATASGVVIATPEYNASVPGLLKNAIDWASRPYPDHALRGKPIIVIGASTGAFGAALAQAELRRVLSAMGAAVLDAQLPVSEAQNAFAQDGRLASPLLRERLATMSCTLSTSRLLTAHIRVSELELHASAMTAIAILIPGMRTGTLRWLRSIRRRHRREQRGHQHAQGRTGGWLAQSVRMGSRLHPRNSRGEPTSAIRNPLWERLARPQFRRISACNLCRIPQGPRFSHRARSACPAVHRGSAARHAFGARRSALERSMNRSECYRSAMATTRLVVAITMASIACRPGFFGYSPRFVVTSEPLRTHDGPGVGLCFAIEASEPAGVWWWGPGKTGCTTRNTLVRPHDEASTGLSALFHPPDGKVMQGGAGTVEARFRLGLHNREQRDSVDVVSIASTESIRSPATGMSVAAKLMDDINIPFSPP